MKPSFLFSIFSTIVTVLIVLLWAFFINHSALTKALLFIMSSYIVGQVFYELVSGRLQLEERYINLSVWQFFPHLSRFLLICFTVFFVSGEAAVTYVAYCYAFTSLIMSFFGFVYLQSMLKNGVQLKQSQEYYKCDPALFKTNVSLNDVIKTCWPFGIGAFAHLVYYQSDVVMIQYFVGDKSAGQYNIAFVVMSAIYLLPSMLYQKFLMPKIHRWSNYDFEKFHRIYTLGTRYMFLLGLASTLALWVMGGWGIELLFGERYRESGELLNILALSAPIIFVALSAGSVLVTQQHMQDKVKYMLVVALVNVALNFYCIPKWGAEGAAATTVISNLLLLSLYLYGANKKVFKPRS